MILNRRRLGSGAEAGTGGGAAGTGARTDISQAKSRAS